MYFSREQGRSVRKSYKGSTTLQKLSTTALSTRGGMGQKGQVVPREQRGATWPS